MRPWRCSTADGAAPILGGRGSVYGGKTSLQWVKNRTIRSRYPKTDLPFRHSGNGAEEFCYRPADFLVKTIDVEPLYDEPAYARWADLRPAAPDPDGNKAVTLTFTMAFLTKAGAELDNVGGMIYRSTGSQLKDATFVADITGIPGSDHTYVDCAENNPETAITEDGQYSYWIRTYYRLGDKRYSATNIHRQPEPPGWGMIPAVRPFDSKKAYLEKVNGGFNVHFVKGIYRQQRRAGQRSRVPHLDHTPERHGEACGPHRRLPGRLSICRQYHRQGRILHLQDLYQLQEYRYHPMHP